MHMFVTKQEIFEKGESNYFFQKVRHRLTTTENTVYTIVMEAGFQNLKSELRSFRVKRKPQKAFLSSGNFSNHFLKPSRRNNLSKF